MRYSVRVTRKIDYDDVAFEIFSDDATTIYNSSGVYENGYNFSATFFTLEQATAFFNHIRGYTNIFGYVALQDRDVILMISESGNITDYRDFDDRKEIEEERVPFSPGPSPIIRDQNEQIRDFIADYRTMWNNDPIYSLCFTLCRLDREILRTLNEAGLGGDISGRIGGLRIILYRNNEEHARRAYNLLIGMDDIEDIIIELYDNDVNLIESRSYGDEDENLYQDIDRDIYDFIQRNRNIVEHGYILTYPESRDNTNIYNDILRATGRGGDISQNINGMRVILYNRNSYRTSTNAFSSLFLNRVVGATLYDINGVVLLRYYPENFEFGNDNICTIL
jgi:hypothetical protein